MATICESGAPARRQLTKRSTRMRVLPVPAPASTRKVVSELGHRPEAVRLVARLAHATPPSSAGPSTVSRGSACFCGVHAACARRTRRSRSHQRHRPPPCLPHEHAALDAGDEGGEPLGEDSGGLFDIAGQRHVAEPAGPGDEAERTVDLLRSGRKGRSGETVHGQLEVLAGLQVPSAPRRPCRSCSRAAGPCVSPSPGRCGRPGRGTRATVPRTLDHRTGRLAAERPLEQRRAAGRHSSWGRCPRLAAGRGRDCRRLPCQASGKPVSPSRSP